MKTQLKGVPLLCSATHQPQLHMDASMLSYILLAALLLPLRAQNCTFSEIIHFTNHLLVSGSLAPLTLPRHTQVKQVAANPDRLLLLLVAEGRFSELPMRRDSCQGEYTAPQTALKLECWVLAVLASNTHSSHLQSCSCLPIPEVSVKAAVGINKVCY